MNQMQTGAREGKLNWLRHLVAQATAQSLQVFVVPEPELARRIGIDLEAVGLKVATTPRHANVLLLTGEIPPGLAKAAAIVYSQMLRPRAIMLIGNSPLPSPLPTPDVQTDYDPAKFEAAVQRLRQLFIEKAWLAEETADFAGPADSPEETETADDHAHIHHGGMDTMMGHSMPMEEMPPEGHEMNPMDMSEMQHSDHNVPVSETEHSHPDMNHTDKAELPHDGQAEMMNRANSAEHKMEHNDHSMSTKASVQASTQEMNHSGHNMAGMDMAEMDHGEHDMGHMNMAGMDHDSHNMSGHDMAEMNHGGHDMMMGGFMSMVAMTQDLPRSRDGLPMEWVETPFGPLFSGLRAGLALNFTLDGEEVAQTKIIPGTLKRGLEEGWPGSVAIFPEKLARLDPLTPVSYRLLALQTIEQAAGIKIDEVQANGRIGLLERERILNHLGWLTKLAELLGDSWLARQTARLQLDWARAENLAETIRLRPALLKLKERWQKAPLLKTRLTRKGQLAPESLEGVTGPVARANELDRDARSDSPAYLNLGFKPQVQKGSDALARLLLRLAELEQSFDLILAANSLAKLDQTVLRLPFHEKVSGTASVETPRGTATLSLTIAHGAVSEVKLTTPSTALVKLIGQTTEGQDLADALVGVASLDLSPWELEL